MPTPYTEDAFAYRVDFAARVISSGQRSTTRAFDTCFEMYDGDAVAVALYRRSRRNPKLRANIWRYLTRAHIVALAWKHRRKSRADLATWAADLRRKAKEASARMMAARDAERAEKKGRVIEAGYLVRPSPTPYHFRYVRPDGSESKDFSHEDSAWHFAHEDFKQQAVGPGAY